LRLLKGFLIKQDVKVCIQESAVGIATGYELVLSPDRVKNLSLLHFVQTGSGAHPDPFPVDTSGSFPRGKEPVA
jgi:hypothetical protein